MKASLRIMQSSVDHGVDSISSIADQDSTLVSHCDVGVSTDLTMNEIEFLERKQKPNVRSSNFVWKMCVMMTRKSSFTLDLQAIQH